MALSYWSELLITGARKLGHTVDYRRDRNGSLKFRLDGGRWLCTFDANRRLEVIVYGRENP